MEVEEKEIDVNAIIDYLIKQSNQMTMILSAVFDKYGGEITIQKEILDNISLAFVIEKVKDDESGVTFKKREDLNEEFKSRLLNSLENRSEESQQEPPDLPDLPKPIDLQAMKSKRDLN